MSNDADTRRAADSATPDIPAIAKSLTKAQRDWLRHMLPLPPNRLYGDGLHRYAPYRNRLQSALALWRRSLVASNEEVQADAWEQGKMGFARLTPLGLSVRAHLLGESK